MVIDLAVLEISSGKDNFDILSSINKIFTRDVSYYHPIQKYGKDIEGEKSRKVKRKINK